MGSRVAVIGTGSIGGYFAGELARAGHDVVMCTRTPFDRLVVEHLDGTRVEVEGPAVTDPSALTPADWVLLATKAHQTDGAAQFLARACGPATRAVAVMQNGVEHEERVRPYVAATPLLPTIVLCGAEAVEHGHVLHHGYSSLEVPAGALADDFAALFAGTDAAITFLDDFVSAAWRKLVQNVTIAPITALTLKRLGIIRRPDVQRLVVALAEECLRVANAAGASLPVESAAAMVAGWQGTNPDMGSSMLYDRMAGRPLEHEALSGAVVRYGRRYGIPTPLNDVIYTLLCTISET